MTEKESNNLILAYGRYNLVRLHGALLGIFDSKRDSEASIAFTVTRDSATLNRLTVEREAIQGKPVFIEANQVSPSGSEPEMKIRKKGETWNALSIRQDTLSKTPGTMAYARAILDSRNGDNPFSG